MTIFDPFTCSVSDLRRLAESFRVAFYIGANGRLVVRPYRGPRPDVHAACVARRDELRDYLSASRSAPFDPEVAANAASWRVCRMPYEVLVALAIHELNTWLARADSGLLAYEPPLPPRWDDDLAQNDRESKPKRRARPQPAPSDRVVFG